MNKNAIGMLQGFAAAGENGTEEGARLRPRRLQCHQLRSVHVHEVHSRDLPRRQPHGQRQRPTPAQFFAAERPVNPEQPLLPQEEVAHDNLAQP